MSVLFWRGWRNCADSIFSSSSYFPFVRTISLALSFLLCFVLSIFFRLFSLSIRPFWSRRNIVGTLIRLRTRLPGTATSPGTINVSVLQNIEADSGAYQASQLMRTGVFSSGVNLLWSEAEHLSLSSAEFKNVWTYTSSPSPHGVDRDKFAFTFLPSFHRVSDWARFSSFMKSYTLSVNLRFLGIGVVDLACVLGSARLVGRNVRLFRLNSRS